MKNTSMQSFAPFGRTDLQYRKVATLTDVQIVRQIRNDCREYMTRSQKLIDEAMQTVWWNELDHTTIQVFLYLENDVACGYGTLRDEDAKTWLAYGLFQQKRGAGYGIQIFKHLLSEAKHDVWIEVFANNSTARSVAAILGFVPTHTEGEIITAVRRCKHG